MWPVRFARDVSTCWNSTYKLICQSDEYKELLCDFMCYNVSFIILNSQQWHKYTKICQLLKAFNDTTNILSSIYYLTTNLFIIKSLNMISAIDNCMF